MARSHRQPLKRPATSKRGQQRQRWRSMTTDELHREFQAFLDDGLQPPPKLLEAISIRCRIERGDFEQHENYTHVHGLPEERHAQPDHEPAAVQETDASEARRQGCREARTST
jgi:hypothetical protein